MFRLFAVAVVAICSTASADVTKFPYEATVMGDDVFVRSGPGKNYYATSRLKRNEHVVVHRHDPGGWYMIAPPAGSISWIDSNLVEQTGNRGVVNVPLDEHGRPGQAIVRIGSSMSDDHSLTGRQLTSGDEVEILGEQVLSTETGATKMFKIAPPAREYRWVKGDFIVPASAAVQKELDSDPYAVPAAHRTPEQFALMEAPPAMPQEPEASTQMALKAPSLPDVIQAADGVMRTAHAELPQTPSHRLGLMEIDNQYADMMALDVSQWRLDELRNAYMAIQAGAPPAITRQIDVRLAALENRQKIYDKYARFTAITEATNRRDAELVASVTGGILPPAEPAPAIELGAPAAFPSMQGMPAQPIPGPEMNAGPALSPPGADVQQAAGESASLQAKLDGAGIVATTQSTAPGVPRHILVAPDGRFLAFLQSTEINLDQYVGQSLGLYGQRGRDPRLQSDLIQVSNVVPVQLSR